MKSLAKLLAGVTIVVVAVLAYLILSSKVTAQVNMNVVPASEYIEEYTRITGSADGADGRYIARITVKADNKGMIPAEWVELHFSTLDGDMVGYEVIAGPVDIAGFGSQTFTANIITSNNGKRGIWLSYYLLGREQVAE